MMAVGKGFPLLLIQFASDGKPDVPEKLRRLRRTHRFHLRNRRQPARAVN